MYVGDAGMFAIRAGMTISSASFLLSFDTNKMTGKSLAATAAICTQIL
jgi:hypothetical protein